MGGRVVPVLRLAVLCSHVEFDRDGAVFSLNEPVHTLRFPSGSSGRLSPPTMVLYLQLADGHGTFYIRAEVRNEAGTVQYRSPRPFEVHFDGTQYRTEPAEVVLDLERLEFPGPGLYEFHVLCNHMSFSDMTTPTPVPFPPLWVRVVAAGA